MTLEPKSSNPNRRLPYLLGIALLVLLAALLFGRHIRQEVTLQLLARADRPNVDTLYATLEQSSHPAAVLQRLWDTRRIPHRLCVLQYLRTTAALHPDLAQAMQPLIVSATRDPDAEVREVAFGTLQALKHPELFNLAKDQLRDPDPELRLLGIQCLRQTDNPRAVPELMPLLEDHDLRVVTTAEAVLRHWTSNDFGIRIHLAIPKQDPAPSSTLPDENLAQLKLGLQRWRDWWKTNQHAYPQPPPAAPSPPPPTPLPAALFSLPSLDGPRVSLAGFRGKVVLLHFWAAWSPACLNEIPTLMALQKLYPDQLVVLGICIDARRQDPIHVRGESAATNAATPPDPALFPEEVRKLVAERGITYPILLDHGNHTADHFNATQLPVNVLVDPHGYIGRRFSGNRSLATWKALVEPLFQSH